MRSHGPPCLAVPPARCRQCQGPARGRGWCVCRPSLWFSGDVWVLGRTLGSGTERAEKEAAPGPLVRAPAGWCQASRKRAGHGALDPGSRGRALPLGALLPVFKTVSSLGCSSVSDPTSQLPLWFSSLFSLPSILNADVLWKPPPLPSPCAHAPLSLQPMCLLAPRDLHSHGLGPPSLNLSTRWKTLRHATRTRFSCAPGPRCDPPSGTSSAESHHTPPPSGRHLSPQSPSPEDTPYLLPPGVPHSWCCRSVQLYQNSSG